MGQQGTLAWLMAAERLGIIIPEPAIGRFDRYRDLLIECNRRINLTSIDEPEDIERLLFLDSLTLLRAWLKHPDHAPTPGDLIVDIGTGAGIPGLPLAFVRPDLRVVLVEATRKKAEFVERVIGELAVRNVEVRWARAEDAARDRDLRAAARLVTGRAVAKLPALVELTLPFAAIGGLAVLPKQQPIEEELQSSGRAIRLLGGRLLPLERIEDPALPVGRVLVVIEKTAETPGLYPRRAGLPSKRPL